MLAAGFAGNVDIANLLSDHPLNEGVVDMWLPEWTGAGDRLQGAKGNHGTLTNGPKWVATERGTGLQSYGGTDYVGIPAIPRLTAATRITAFAIIRPIASGRNDFFGQWTNGGYKWLLTYGVTANRFSFYLYRGDFPNATDSVDITYGNTYAVVGGYDGTNAILDVCDLTTGAVRSTSASAVGTTLITSGVPNLTIGKSGDDAANAVIFAAAAFDISPVESLRSGLISQSQRGFPDLLRRPRRRSVAIPGGGGGGATPWLYARRQPQIIGGGMGL